MADLEWRDIKWCLREPLSEIDGKRPSLSSGSGDGLSRPGDPFSMSQPCGDAGALSPRTLLRACAFSLLGLHAHGSESGDGWMALAGLCTHVPQS